MKGRCLLLVLLPLILLAACDDGARQRLQLKELERMNRVDSLMTNDSLALDLAEWFDDHGTPNEQMRAYYILGRTYADLGEAPQAIEAYNDAADRADTTAEDCNYWTLCRVYTQMANVLYYQGLYSEDLKCLDLATYYGYLASDTLSALLAYAQKMGAYHMMKKPDSMLAVSNMVYQQLCNVGYPEVAAGMLSHCLYYLIDKGEFELAYQHMKIYENESGFFDNVKYQDRFYKLWEQFAQRFGKNADMLAFELLNEVTKKEYCEKWNDISYECIRRIRKIAPKVKILVGGYYNNSIEALKDLAAPYDENIVYNFHCYEPLIFTHQGAHWIEKMNDDFRMPYDSTYGTYIENNDRELDHITGDMSSYDKQELISAKFFDDYLAEAVKIAEERNVQLYCGEYGVIDKATPEDALKWYKDICGCFDKYGIGRAAWSYKEMDFGISDERMKGVVDKLIKLL